MRCGGNIKGGGREPEAGLQRRPDLPGGRLRRRPDGQEDDRVLREVPVTSRCSETRPAPGGAGLFPFPGKTTMAELTSPPDFRTINPHQSILERSANHGLRERIPAPALRVEGQTGNDSPGGGGQQGSAVPGLHPRRGTALSGDPKGPQQEL